MNIDTSKPYTVVNSETQISIKSFKTKEEAQEYANFMTDYHGLKHEVKDLRNV